MQRFQIVAAFVTALAFAPPVAADAFDTVVPVLLQAPSCSHDKLGQVSIQVGTRVRSHRDLMVSPLLRRGVLAGEGGAGGADAVVVRWHQATYFTRNARRSHRPVHVQLRGAAISTHADARPCDFALADASEFDERARSGKPVEVASGDAYDD
jgi:hypothetical protein